ncbi:MAG: hypothetical protein SVO01_00595 [Thermotogota bacterium]|nr:hypothetical protein [Thermotogota bacterium]
MNNIDLKVEDKKLTITIDLSKEYGRSKSGKTIVVASTLGNHRIDGTDIHIGINAYKYPK